MPGVGGKRKRRRRRRRRRICREMGGEAEGEAGGFKVVRWAGGRERG